MENILQTENLAFLIPLCASITWFLLGLFLSHFSHADMDADADGDVDVDANADADADADADGQTNAQAHPAIELATIMSYAGIGKIPVVLWFQILSIIWGVSGLVCVSLGFAWASYLVAGASAIIGTSAISHVLARLLPNKIESDLIPRNQRIGMVGVVVSTKVDAEFGEGRFRTDKGMVYMPIRVERESLPEHTEIIVMDITKEGVALVQRAEDLLRTEKP